MNDYNYPLHVMEKCRKLNTILNSEISIYKEYPIKENLRVIDAIAEARDANMELALLKTFLKTKKMRLILKEFEDEYLPSITSRYAYRECRGAKNDRYGG